MLANGDQYPNFAFDQDKIEQTLGPLGFQPLGFFESQGHERNGGTHCLVALHDDAVKVNKLAVAAFRGTNKDDPADVMDDVDAEFLSWKATTKVYDGWRDAFAEVETIYFRSSRPSITNYFSPATAWALRRPRCSRA